jgi:hypothetical protein
MSNLDFLLMSYKIKNPQNISRINNNVLVQMVLWLLKKLVILFGFSPNVVQNKKNHEILVKFIQHKNFTIFFNNHKIICTKALLYS